MKKSTKLFLIISGFLILFGTVLSIIGLSFGGRRFLQENGWDQYSLINSNGIPMLNWGNDDWWEEQGWWEEHGWSGNSENEYSGTFSDIEIADGKDVRDIDIKIGAAVLYIEESEDDMIRLEADTRGKIECYVEGEELKLNGIKYPYKLNQSADVIYLYLPKGSIFENVKVEVGAGAVYGDGIKAQNMETETGAGEMEYTKLDIQEFFGAEVGAGHLLIEDSVIGDGEFKAGMGAIEYDGKVLRDLDIDSDVGTISLSLSGQEQGQNYDLNCDVGTIMVGNTQYTHLFGDDYIDNNASALYEIDCSVGTVTIDFQ